MLYLRITYVDISLCKDTLPNISLHCCSLVFTYNVLVCLMDDGGVSQQVMQENPIAAFFLNTHCEIYPEQAFDYTN